MSFSLIAHTTITGAGTTGALNTTGADFIAVPNVANFAGSTTVADSKGNTFSFQSGTADPTTFFHYGFWYCINPIVGAGHTFTIGGSDTAGHATCIAAFGSAAGTYGSKTTNGNTGSTTIQPGTLTPAGSPALLIAVYCNRGSTAFSAVDSGFVFSDTISYNSGGNYGMGLAYLYQASASAVNPTGTVPTTPNSLTIGLYSFYNLPNPNAIGTFGAIFG